MTEVSVTARPLAPWIQRQARHLLAQRGHAWLLHGPSGLGQYGVGMTLVRAWLCEAPVDGLACGHCESCHAIDVRTHADLCVLMPETDMLELGWPLSEKAAAEIDDKKRKPSREIRVEAMRDAVEFAQRTSARGRGKAILVYPAERMNGITANALLKTLEEPPGDVKFVLASESAHQLLPTIRSRCLGYALQWPTEQDSLHWLQSLGLPADAANLFLRIAGGRPENALAFANSGRDASSWTTFPQAMAQGNVNAVRDWTVQQLVDAQQKLCHDLLASGGGAQPRFFSAADLTGLATSTMQLSAWGKELARCVRTMEHPFNPGLMQEALVGRAQTALNSPATQNAP